MLLRVLWALGPLFLFLRGGGVFTGFRGLAVPVCDMIDCAVRKRWIELWLSTVSHEIVLAVR